MAFGDFIRQKREEAGIPLNDFARRIDISPAYWSRIERNMEKPPKDDLITLAARSGSAGQNNIGFWRVSTPRAGDESPETQFLRKTPRKVAGNWACN